MVIGINELLATRDSSEDVFAMTYGRLAIRSDENANSIEYLSDQEFEFTTGDDRGAATIDRIPGYVRDPMFAPLSFTPSLMDLHDPIQVGAHNQHPVTRSEYRGTFSIDGEISQDDEEFGCSRRFAKGASDTRNSNPEDRPRITPNDNSLSMGHRKRNTAASLWREVYRLRVSNGADGHPQSDGASCLFEPIQDGEIDRSIPPIRSEVAEEVHTEDT